MTTNAEMKEKLLFVCNKIDEVLKQNHEMKTKEIQIKSQEENIIDNSPNYIGRINSLKTQMELLQKNLEEIYNIDKVNQLESEIKEKEQILKTLKNEKKLLNQAVKEQNKGINEYITKFDSTKDIQELTEQLKKVKEENHSYKAIYKEINGNNLYVFEYTIGNNPYAYVDWFFPNRAYAYSYVYNYISQNMYYGRYI